MIALPGALKNALATTLTAPESVIAPPAFTTRFPDTVEVPTSIPFTSRSVTSLPLTTDTAPWKSLDALLNVTLFAEPAVRLVTPDTVTFPVPV